MAPSNKKDGAENQKPDWAEIYADLLCHTSLSYEEIGNRTIPQIDAIRSRLGKHVALKIGIPGIFGGALDNPPPSPTPDRPPKLSEFMAFANAFNDIK